MEGCKYSPVLCSTLSTIVGSILDDTYDERDVKWVKTDDGFLRSVLACGKAGGNVAKAVDMLNGVLLFRAKWKANGMA